MAADESACVSTWTASISTTAFNDTYGRKYLWLDLVALGQKLRPRNEIACVKYFTADVIGEPHAPRRQAAYINALTARRRTKVQVFKGRYQSSGQSCRNCGATWARREEKKTDVNIALHILRDALQATYDSALIISGDSDMSPAIRMVQASCTDHFMTVAFPPSRLSYELERLMPASFVISETKLRQSQLPDSFEDGLHPRVHVRPEKWH